MTPERIAQLRGVARVHEYAETRSDYVEMLDAIERLRELVARAHVVHAAQDAVLLPDGVTALWQVECTVEDCDFETQFTGSGREFYDAVWGIGAVHVRQITDGGAS